MNAKVSSAQLSELLKEGADTLRKTASERDFFKEKCAKMERRERCEKIAREMHTKGIDADQTVEDIADRIEKSAGSGSLDLSVVEQALEWQGTDMGQKIGHLTSDDPRPTGSGSQLESYLNGFVGSVG